MPKLNKAATTQGLFLSLNSKPDCYLTILTQIR